MVRQILKALVSTSTKPRIPIKDAVIEKHVDQGSILIEKRADGLYIGGQKVVLYCSPRQMDKKFFNGGQLWLELYNKPVLLASILDFLIDNPDYIPEEWKDEDENGHTPCICFWGTIYRRKDGFRFVRCLFWKDDSWHEGCYWLANESGRSLFAAALESINN